MVKAMSFPSRGCQTCKVRRIKCDQTRPVCLKCTKSRRVCQGLGDAQNLAVIHIENHYASGQNKRPRGPRPAFDSQIGQPRLAFSTNSVDLNTLAVAYYVRYHLQSPSNNPETLKSLLQCIPSRWAHHTQDQMLDLALSSKALATFSRTQKHPPAALEASSKYRELLKLTSSAISRLNLDNVDACLLAIFLMSRYESVIYPSSQHQSQSPFFVTLQSFSHHDGASAVLKAWVYRFSHIQPPTDVVKLSRRGLIRSALLRGLEIPHWMLEGSVFGESGLDLEFDHIVTQIANIRSRVSQAEHDSSESEDLGKETQDTDKALQRWAAKLPTLWPFTKHNISNTSKSSSQRYFYSPVIYSYSSPACAGIWANYYATRMLLLSTLISILEICCKQTAAEECHRQMELMANDLASSLPFCLQRFTSGQPDSLYEGLDHVSLNKSTEVEPCLASLMVWPLSLASSLKHVKTRHQAWFRSMLAQLGRIIGIGMLEYANTARWPVF